MLDLAGRVFLGSSGVHALRKAPEDAQRRRVRLRIVAATAQVVRVLRLFGVDIPLPVFETVDDAFPSRVGSGEPPRKRVGA